MSGVLGIIGESGAGLADFIASLDGGYKIPAGELGSRLSAGERQRISIARALLKDSEFIILDEPTSNLDSVRERHIIETIRQAFRDKTVLLIFLIGIGSLSLATGILSFAWAMLLFAALVLAHSTVMRDS
jgi:ABC-type protease/lipase transport system fused ATPase/permease subunit